MAKSYNNLETIDLLFIELLFPVSGKYPGLFRKYLKRQCIIMMSDGADRYFRHQADGVTIFLMTIIGSVKIVV